MKTYFHCDKSGLSETFQVIACSCGCFPLDVEHKEDEGGDSAKNEVKLSSCCAPVCDICVCTFVCFRLWKFNLSVNCSRSQKKIAGKMTWNLFFQPLDYERNGTLMVKYQIHLVLCLKTRVPVLYQPSAARTLSVLMSTLSLIVPHQSIRETLQNHSQTIHLLPSFILDRIDRYPH